MTKQNQIIMSNSTEQSLTSSTGSGSSSPIEQVTSQLSQIDLCDKPSHCDMSRVMGINGKFYENADEFYKDLQSMILNNNTNNN